MMKGGQIREAWGWGVIIALAAAFMASFISFQVGVWALFFATAGWWVWKYPEKGFLLLIVLMPLLPLVKITKTADTVTLAKDVIILTLFIKTVARPFLKKTLPYRRNVFWGPIIVLAAWAALAAVRADNLLLGVFRLRDIGLYMILFFAALYLPVSLLIWKERLAWFCASVVSAALLGVYQLSAAGDSAVLRFDPVREIWIPRMSGMMAHPSIFGHYLLIAFTLGVPAGVGLWQRGKKRLAVGFFLGDIILLVEMFLTYSRGVWIGAAAAVMVWMGIYGWMALKRKNITVNKSWILGGVGVLAVASAVFVFSGLGDQAILYARRLVDPSYRSNQERLEFVARLIAPMENKEALVGRGLGDVLKQNLRQVEISTFDVATGSSQSIRETKDRTLVDNQYLKTWVEMGIVGLMIYLWLFLRFFKGASSLLRQDNFKFQISNFKLIISWWGLGFLTAFVMQGFFIDVWEIFPTNAWFWIIAAFVSAAAVRPDRKTV